MRCGALVLAVVLTCTAGDVSAKDATPIIFDTDVGNDVDDVLALGVIHSLQTRGECRLIAVTATKDQDLVAPFIDAVNTFYGRGDISIGVVKKGKTPEPSKFLPLAAVKDGGKFRYPHDLQTSADAPDATTILRRVLVAERDGTVVIAQVGFSTNLARLLESPGDNISPLSGKELVAKKVKLLSIMGGAFLPIDGNDKYMEYNITNDVPAAQKLAADWPGPIVYSGFEIGIAIPYPAVSIEQDYGYVEHHPLAESYQLYEPPPHNRPTWDLTSVLYALRPDRGYFGVSQTGTVSFDAKGVTMFQPASDGKHRYLTLSAEQQAKVTEALVQLSSQPPSAVK